jgi:hypothetical protein
MKFKLEPISGITTQAFTCHCIYGSFTPPSLRGVCSVIGHTELPRVCIRLAMRNILCRQCGMSRLRSNSSKTIDRGVFHVLWTYGLWTYVTCNVSNLAHLCTRSTRGSSFPASGARRLSLQHTARGAPRGDVRSSETVTVDGFSSCQRVPFPQDSSLP